MVLSSPLVFHTLQSLRNKRVLNPLQWEKVFPAVASTVSSANFNVTLLMVLLRNICGLSPPTSTGNWDMLPPDSDKSTEANIVKSSSSEMMCMATPPRRQLMMHHSMHCGRNQHCYPRSWIWLWKRHQQIEN